MRLTVFFLVIFLLNIFSAYSEQTIIINEIMPGPVSPEPEWIELFNPSEDSFSAAEITLSDAKTTKTIDSIYVPPTGYAILTKDTAELRKTRTIPDSAMLFVIPLPGLNNSWDEIVLRTRDGDLIDSAYYDFDWTEKGISLERVDWSAPALNNDNLVESADPSGATCGYENSVSRPEKDLALVSNPNSGQNEIINLKIINAGFSDAEEYSVEISIDLDKNGEYSSDELVFNTNPGEVNPGDSLEIQVEANEITELNEKFGRFSYEALIIFSGDENHENDSSSGEFFLSYPENSLLINEILFDIDDKHGEFIEIYNNTEYEINLRGWSISDKAADEPDEYFVIRSEIILPPAAYFVATWDSSFFDSFENLYEDSLIYAEEHSLNLNSGGDEIIFRDPAGITMDSLDYSDSWHNYELPDTKNISLEKISPELISTSEENWSSCSADSGSTPRAANSLSYPPPKEGSLSAEPNPFSPSGTGSSSVCQINYELPFSRANVIAKVFTPGGIEVRELENFEALAGRGTLEWDGTNDPGSTLPAGPYVLLFEAQDVQSNKVFSEKILIVIGN